MDPGESVGRDLQSEVRLLAMPPEAGDDGELVVSEGQGSRAPQSPDLAILAGGWGLCKGGWRLVSIAKWPNDWFLRDIPQFKETFLSYRVKFTLQTVCWSRQWGQVAAGVSSFLCGVK